MRENLRMITACHNCQFDGKGRLLEELLPNETTTDTAAIAAKDVLLRYFSARCVNCKRTNQDDIRIEKAPHNVRPELTTAIKDHAQSEQATRLSPQAEDTLRRLVMTITALDPLDALMLFHVAKGGTFSTFGRFVNRVFDEARLYGPSITRMTARAKWLAICKTFAPFATLRQWTEGHAARDDANATPDADKESTQLELGL